MRQMVPQTSPHQQSITNMEINPFQRDFEEQTLRSLYRKMKKTSKARFNAATRLRRHQRFSLWSLAFVSAGLIILRLLSVFQMRGQISEPVFSFIEIVLALFVLVISLLLSANDFSDQAEKMHRCALELNVLCHEILPACADGSDHSLFAPTLQKYSTILNSYANHANIDFALVKLELPSEYPLRFLQRCRIHFAYWLHYSVYGLLIALLGGVFVFIFAW